MSLSVRKLTIRTGAVIEGVDLAAEPSGETIAALRGALNHSRQLVGDVSHYSRILEAAA
jgi:hypothetical protein